MCMEPSSNNDKLIVKRKLRQPGALKCIIAPVRQVIQQRKVVACNRFNKPENYSLVEYYVLLIWKSQSH
jgi:hypothetical protein